MAISYLSCGNIMSDRIQNPDGTFSESNMGGPAFYALSGIRLWTPDVKLVCKTGADYKDTYGKWMDANGVSRESVREEMEEVTRFALSYNPDGSFTPKPEFSMEHLGYLKTHADDIDEACEGYQIRGIYMAHSADAVVWKNIERVKAKRGFKMMWEIEYSNMMKGRPMEDRLKFIDKIRNALQVADAWSLNHNEASDLFNIPREDDYAIINELQKLPVEFTFYRVGSRGSYAVTPTNAYFCPSIDPFGESVDPTGCGNCSTGTAGYAYFDGNHPAMAAAMANVSSGFNAAQRGPYPLYTQEKTELAKKLAEECFAKMKAEQHF